VRILPDGRVHASTYGPPFGPERATDWRAVDARVRRLFPQIGAPRWSQGWSGWVAMTQDHFPRLHEPAPGLFAGLGYNGRGIAAATMMGRDLSTLVRGAIDAAKLRDGTNAAAARSATDRSARDRATDMATVFPLEPLRPLAWHRAAPPLLRALVQVYRAHDLLHELRSSHSPKR
jgi:hypothetical protein